MKNISQIRKRLLEENLLEDEEIIWQGQPETKVIFTTMDIIYIPVSILFIGYILKDFFIDGFNIIGIPFLLAGIYILFGRFIYKAWKKQNIFYFVTNKRILILTRVNNRNLQERYIHTITNVNKSIRSDGIGTIYFGDPSPIFLFKENTGLDFLNKYSFDIFDALCEKNVPVFYDTQEAEQVYRLVNELRKDKK